MTFTLTISNRSCYNGTQEGYNTFSQCLNKNTESIGIVDSSITKFYDDMIKTYPNNSFSAISLMVDESWEKVKLGEVSLFEISISTPGLYYVFYGLIEGGKVDCETE